VNILITGANGFLAKELIEYYQDNSQISNRLLLTDRHTLDPTNFEDVRKFFDENVVDVVIHTAVKGGKRLRKDSVDDIIDNISMFKNLSYFSDYYKIMFNFGSGAEFDRMRAINKAKETSIHTRNPRDYYGLSKKIISTKIVESDSNIYNLRLFGCFGRNEEPQRLFRSCYDKFRSGKDAQISYDKYMDYFYSQDVGRVMDFIISNPRLQIPRDINLCYEGDYKLSDYASTIKRLTNSPNDVMIHHKELAKSYTGDCERLKSLNIDLIGLNQGVEKCLKSWSKS